MTDPSPVSVTYPALRALLSGAGYEFVEPPVVHPAGVFVELAGEELRRIRKKLKLNQVEASRLTGGGHNAFSRYETGKVIPAPAVVNLFRLLDRHPEELERLKRA